MTRSDRPRDIEHSTACFGRWRRRAHPPHEIGFEHRLGPERIQEDGERQIDSFQRFGRDFSLLVHPEGRTHRESIEKGQSRSESEAGWEPLEGWAPFFCVRRDLG